MKEHTLMCTRLSLPIAFLYLLSALFLLTATARADDDSNNNGDEYDEHARVLRVSLLKGEVTLQRAGGDEWETAQLNTPLVEGDTLATGRDARLEIQADSRNFIRVGENSVLKVVTLRDEGIALSLSEGTATVRLSRFDRDKEYFEVDAPKTTVAAERTGQYRIDVDAQGGVNVTVREDGRARIYSENSGFELRNNRTARFALNDGGEGDWELGAAAQFDEWDYWNDERERYIASHLKYEGRERYYDPEVYGAEELDLYGDWVYTRDYGYIWRPSVTVVNNYNDWAPYRYGHWDWCEPYGWTWIADEPWGWAPYHYGRWVYVNNNWCWAPRGYGYRYRRAWWRPALVTFVTIDFGRERNVCWYPLTYGQRDPRGRWWSRRFDPLTPLRRGDVDNLRRANPALLRAVTSAPASRFGVANLHARAAIGDLAQRALAGDPIRGRLPFEPSNAQRVVGPHAGGTEGRATPGGRASNGREGLTLIRPAPVMPPRVTPEPPTGASARTPGVPLDEELRRTRLFGDRQPRVLPPSTAGSGAQSGADNTGAVARPNPVHRPPPDAGTGEPSTGTDARTHRPEPGGHDNSSMPHARPTRPPTQTTPVERPDEDRQRELTPKREPVYRPEPRMPDDGPRSAPRQEPPVYRPEPPAPRSEPRSQPPRQEPPHREAPRQEAPRQEPPHQQAPRQESPRQESQREERHASRPSRDSERPARKSGP